MSKTNKPAGEYCCFVRGTLGYLDRERGGGHGGETVQRKSITQILWDSFWHWVRVRGLGLGLEWYRERMLIKGNL